MGHQLGKRKGEEGIALIAVLWVLILLSLMAVSFALETRTSANVARNIADNAAARAAADAGIQRAILDVEGSPDPRSDDERIRTDGKVYAWSFANSIVHISIQDESAKINLNQAPKALLVELFSSVGVDPDTAQSLADAIADFRDADNLRRLRGAEDGDYRAAGLAWSPKNAPFQAVDELKQVLGITPDLYERVAPYLTIYTVGAGIDPSLAGERMTGILRRAGFKHFVNSPGVAYTICAISENSKGAVFARKAVVMVNKNTGTTKLLSWQ